MISKTNNRCLLCHKMMKFCDLSNGIIKCETPFCLCSSISWIGVDTYRSMDKLKLLEEIAYQLEGDISVYEDKLKECQELIYAEQEC